MGLNHFDTSSYFYFVIMSLILCSSEWQKQYKFYLWGRHSECCWYTTIATFCCTDFTKVLCSNSLCKQFCALLPQLECYTLSSLMHVGVHVPTYLRKIKLGTVHLTWHMGSHTFGWYETASQHPRLLCTGGYSDMVWVGPCPWEFQNTTHTYTKFSRKSDSFIY